MQTRIWHPADPDGTRSADVAGGIAGAPVRLAGVIRLVPEGTSTTEAFDLHVTASVPVFGRRVERVVSDALVVGLDMKFEVAWSRRDDLTTSGSTQTLVSCVRVAGLTNR